MRKVLFPLVVFIAPLWSVHSFFNLKGRAHWNLEVPFEINRWEVFALMHIVIFLIAIWIWVELLLQFAHRKGHGRYLVRATSNQYRAFLLGGLALAAHQPSLGPHTHKVPEVDSIPIGLFLSPPMATLLISDLLRRRREQIRLQILPDVLSEKEQVLLSDVQNLATKNNHKNSNGELDFLDPVVRSLVSAIERESVEPESFEPLDTDEPLLVVRLYGYPEVRGVDGQSAIFRKKRALELVVWLSLNRDRPRRSAARMALWQVDVSDSTFSTIVSDMRRGIAEVTSDIERSELVPTTYSDELSLSKRVTTDYELLRQALQKFREEPNNYRALVGELKSIRDAPFSGTTYEWADLDGTTTRLIITAMQAAHELAEYARIIRDVESMHIACAAGLRVMPGDEVLLQIQQSFIPVVSMSRSVKTH